MTKHDQIIHRVVAALNAANRPMRLKELREGIPEFDGQYVNVTLHHESYRAEPRVVRCAFGVYALPEWDANGEWRSTHAQIIDAAYPILVAAGRPLRPIEVWDQLHETKFSPQNLNLALNRESKRSRGKVRRATYGLYYVPADAPGPVTKPPITKPVADAPTPESPKTYIAALCDVILAYEPDLTDEQRKTVSAALQAIVVDDLLGGGAPPEPKGWLERLGLGN